MANEEDLKRLKDVKSWNRWRRSNETVPALIDADLAGMKLERANLGGAKLAGAKLDRALLFDANLTGADLTRARLVGAILALANLTDANLTTANLTDANLTDANLTNADCFDADINGANLTGADLMGTNLEGADLTGANLTGADLMGTNLEGADLTGANLTGAHLMGTNLEGANLTDANLTRAELSEVKLTDANFDGTNFQNAVMQRTIFANCDLTEAKGLESVTHAGPSSVGIDTIYKSKGKIPENFLRGCGVPEALITHMKGSIGAEDRIQFYSCFISYSHQDEEFAKRLHGKMRDANMRVWYAPEDVISGVKLHEQIERAIRTHDKLLIVLSEASLNSEWVMTELRNARQAERRSGERKLFPVRLVDFERLREWECFDADSGKDLGVELREYFIPDFSHWKELGQFEASFARLLKDLKAESAAPR